MAAPGRAKDATAAGSSAWSPFAHAAFTVLWTATVISNVGTWMHDVAAGWLMTNLSPSPLMVALVQAATTLPMFLFALPAGALADLIDRRHLLIAAMVLLGGNAAGLALVVLTGHVTAWLLLCFTFISGAGAAFVAPAWQAIVPQLVPRSGLQPAVALNSVGINISRAIGPALAGLIIASAGVAWPFLLNALSFLAVIAALLWWKPPVHPPAQLPAERLWSAIRTGLRHARASGPLRDTLFRAVAFFLFASAYWALMPLIARTELGGGPTLYGTLLAAVGIGAVAGAMIMPMLRKHMSADAMAAAGSAGMALVLTVLATVKLPAAAIAVSLLAGASWIAVLSSLNVSAQLALPDWVRARGLSVFITVFFGSMTLGSILWGQVATLAGIPAALLAAAGGALLGVPVSWRFKLQQGAGADHSPSSHWPQPVLAKGVAHQRGPVMVTVEYEVAKRSVPGFLAAMEEMRRMRLRDGAYAWGIYEDAATPGRFLEYFMEESWLAHLRHHERVSGADRALQESVLGFHKGRKAPLVTHYVAPGPGERPPAKRPRKGGLK